MLQNRYTFISFWIERLWKYNFCLVGVDVVGGQARGERPDSNVWSIVYSKEL